jgi:hypothetical protein
LRFWFDARGHRPVQPAGRATCALERWLAKAVRLRSSPKRRALAIARAQTFVLVHWASVTRAREHPMMIL